LRWKSLARKQKLRLDLTPGAGADLRNPVSEPQQFGLRRSSSPV